MSIKIVNQELAVLRETWKTKYSVRVRIEEISKGLKKKTTQKLKGEIGAAYAITDKNPNEAFVIQLLSCFLLHRKAELSGELRIFPIFTSYSSLNLILVSLLK